MIPVTKTWDGGAERGLPTIPIWLSSSGSLDFPIPAFQAQSGRKVLILTHGKSDKERRRKLEDEGRKSSWPATRRVRAAISTLWVGEITGRSTATGPRVHHLLLADNALDRLYTTVAHRLLGGEPFSSLVEGDLLRPAIGMRLQAHCAIPTRWTAWGSNSFVTNVNDRRLDRLCGGDGAGGCWDLAAR